MDPKKGEEQKLSLNEKVDKEEKEREKEEKEREERERKRAEEVFVYWTRKQLGFL